MRLTPSDGSAQPAFGVIEINRRGVIHGVIAIIKRHFLGKDAEGFLHRGMLIDRPAKANRAFVHGFDVRFQHRDRVAFRVNGDKNDLKFIRHLANAGGDFRQGVKRHGADFRAMGKAKKHRHGLAQQIIIADGTALGGGQAKRDLAKLREKIRGGFAGKIISPEADQNRRHQKRANARADADDASQG